LERHLSDEKENIPPPILASSFGTEVVVAYSENVVVDHSPLRPRHLQAGESFKAMENLKADAAYPLVGREKECAQLDSFLQQNLSKGASNGGCLYVSGGPGTGKTCSVRASIHRWQRLAPDTRLLEVNCMDLTQRSVPGVLHRLLAKLGVARPAARSMQGLAALAASKLSSFSSRVVIVVDEVDQLISRSGGQAASGALSLETLFSLPHLPNAPAVAIIAIANAVDLLERTVVLSRSVRCRTLLFEAYGKDQLKSIVTSRAMAAEGGEEALKALGPVKLELRVRQVAKESGDCRQVLPLIEEVILEARAACEAKRRDPDHASGMQLSACDGPVEAPVEVLPLMRREVRPLTQSNRNDPLQAIPQLPLEQQILLFALATSKAECAVVNDICARYKELCQALRQPDNLGSRGQVNNALSALEQRGLLDMRGSRNVGRGRVKLQPSLAKVSVELSVSCSALCETVVKALPLLQRYMD
jgi:Cdc6-like AAA superfamily ATPase